MEINEKGREAVEGEEVMRDKIHAAVFALYLTALFAGLPYCVYEHHKSHEKTASDILDLEKKSWERISRTTYNDCTKDDKYHGSYSVAIGLDALINITTGGCEIIIGNHAGTKLTTERNVILIGDNTQAPEGVSYFVNIDNRFCFDRRTGKKLKCPKHN